MPRDAGVLLDTNTVIWWMRDDARLGIVASHVIEEAETPIYVSAMMPWESQIKRRKHHQPLLNPQHLDQLAEHGFELLPITAEDGLVAGALPRHHEDPFDRMLVAQCMRRGLALITSDKLLRRYDIPVLPATA